MPEGTVYCPAASHHGGLGSLDELGVRREGPPAVGQDQRVSGRRRPGQGWQAAGSWRGARGTVFGVRAGEGRPGLAVLGREAGRRAGPEWSCPTSQRPSCADFPEARCLPQCFHSGASTLAPLMLSPPPHRPWRGLSSDVLTMSSVALRTSTPHLPLTSTCIFPWPPHPSNWSVPLLLFPFPS